MAYDPNEPDVLQAWDTESEFEDSESEREVCMVVHTVRAHNNARVAEIGGEPLD